MAAPVAQNMSADFSVNGCSISLEGKMVITTEEDTHTCAVEGFGLLNCSRMLRWGEGEWARWSLLVRALA